MSNLRTIYTDGGCHEGIGTWAYVMIDGIAGPDSEPCEKGSGLILDTTNNRMEMVAIINGVKSLPPGSKVRVYSDSGYVVTGYNHPSYLKKWMHNGWRNSKKQPVENQDLWNEIIILGLMYDVQFILIGGHGKNKSETHNMFNNMVDRTCTALREEYKSRRDDN